MASVSKPFLCRLCHRQFARAEHLDRHDRTHTKERPFPCNHCPQKFARTDLRRRHLLLHHATEPVLEDGMDSVSDTTRRSCKRLRLRNACDHCNLKKLMCDSARPCARCRSRGIHCVVSAERYVGRPGGLGESRGSPSRSRTSATQVGSDSIETTTGEPLQSFPLDWRLLSEGDGTAATPQRIYTSCSPVLDFDPLDSTNVLQRPCGSPVAGEDFQRWELQNAANKRQPMAPMGDVARGEYDFAQIANAPRPLPPEQFPSVTDLFENMDSLCELFPESDTFDFGLGNSLSFDWGGIGDWTQHAVYGLQDAFDIDASSLNPPLVTSPDVQDQYALPTAPVTTASHTRHARRNAFSTFENLTNVVFSRPASPDALRARLQWFSGPDPNDANTALMQDHQIIDYFMWLFHDNIAHWFSVFRNQKAVITKDTRKEWYLLMAAVGGLFCHRNGATLLAKSFYQIGRQHLLSFVCVRTSQSFTSEESISIIESFVLLQLFGYLCGDKRIYELTEITHAHMLQVALDLRVYTANGIISEAKRQDIREALLILDCYRVVLHQRPPGTPLGRLFEDTSTAEAIAANCDRLPQAIAAITTTRPLDAFTEDPWSSSEGLSALCYLSLLTCPQSSSSSDTPSDNNRIFSTSGFCELSLHQWKIAHAQSSPDRRTLILFHTIHLNMFVCIPDIQNLAVKYLGRHQDDGGEHNNSSGRGFGDKDLGMAALAGLFKSPADREKATWHAIQILGHAHSAIDQAKLANIHRPATSTPSYEPKLTYKAPHFSYCVSFAVLTLWCESMLACNIDEQAARKWLKEGIELLSSDSMGQSHIEGHFRSILTDLCGSNTAD